MQRNAVTGELRRNGGDMSERSVPILPSRDLRESLAFYGTLGFVNGGAPPEEWDYLILVRGDIELHFLASPNIAPPVVVSCYLFVEDAQALYEGWAVALANDSESRCHLVAPMNTDYGMREFTVTDPSGNIIRVGSVLGP